MKEYFQFNKMKKNAFALGAMALCLNSITIKNASAADDETFMGSGIPLHGFASAGFGIQDPLRFSNQDHGYLQGFYLNNVDLYLSPDLGGRVRFLTEIALEPSSVDQTIGIDTERLQVGYAFSNYLTAWVGRFHTPLGFYIIAYHHGSLLQTAVDKPRFLDFEDHFGAVPVHTTGLWLTGNAVIGENRLGYMVWTGNGDRISGGGSADTAGNYNSLDMNQAHDSNKDTTVGGRVTWFFGGALDGLQIGATGMRQLVDGDPQVVSSNGNQISTRLFMYGVHAVYENHGVEFLNELYGFSNKDMNDVGTPTHNSAAGYSQFGYWVSDTNVAYARYEAANFNRFDPFFNAQSNGLSYSKGALGFRHNLSDAAALKFELARTTLKASNGSYEKGDTNSFKAEFAVRF